MAAVIVRCRTSIARAMSMAVPARARRGRVESRASATCDDDMPLSGARATNAVASAHVAAQGRPHLRNASSAVVTATTEQRNRIDDLVGQPERFAARRENPNPGAAVQERRGDAGGALDDAIAVVQENSVAQSPEWSRAGAVRLRRAHRDMRVSAMARSSSSRRVAASSRCTPSGKRPAIERAVSTAKRVLPAPPIPTTLTIRCVSTIASSSARSRSRPTSELANAGR